jgi:hypothetical protein
VSSSADRGQADLGQRRRSAGGAAVGPRGGRRRRGAVDERTLERQRHRV